MHGGPIGLAGTLADGSGDTLIAFVCCAGRFRFLRAWRVPLVAGVVAAAVLLAGNSRCADLSETISLFRSGRYLECAEIGRASCRERV